MTDHTILVVDADQETQAMLISTLESEGYLVFTATGRDIRTGLAENINPALIFLKPGAISVEGFATCKAIHNSDTFRDVPIILLASLKGPLDPRYTTFYGVVDYLRLPLKTSDVVSKTEKILGRPGAAEFADSDFGTAAEAYASPEETLSPEDTEGIASPDESHSQETQHYGDTDEREAAAAVSSHETAQPEETEDYVLRTDDRAQDAGASVQDDFGMMEAATLQTGKETGGVADRAIDSVKEEISDIGQPNEDYRYRETHDTGLEDYYHKADKRRSRRSPLLLPVVSVAAGAAILLAGYLIYQVYFAGPVSVVAPKPVQQAENVNIPPVPEQVKDIPSEVTAPPAEIKELPAKAVPAAPEAETDGKPFYAVQLGAFRNEVAASALAKTYKEKGYEAYTQKGEIRDKGTFFRVLVGTYTDRKEALQLADQIGRKEKLKTTVFSGRKK